MGENSDVPRKMVTTDLIRRGYTSEEKNIKH